MTKHDKMIRVWKKLDVDKVKDHLLLIDDHYGVCGKCKQTGLNYVSDKYCRNCKTKFEYLATKLTNPGEVGKILQRIQKEQLLLQVIDRSDFERSSAKAHIDNLFK